MTLTISLVYYDTEKSVLASTLRSIENAIVYARKAGLDMSVKLVLIDNGASQTFLNQILEDSVDANACDIVLIESGGNIGYGAGHNLAILNFASDYHLVINPDVLVDSHALDTAIRYMEKNKRVGILTPYSENTEGKKQNLCKNYPSVFRLFLRGFMSKSVNEYFEKRLKSYEVNLKKDTSTILDRGVMASGCFMFSRYDVLEKIRGFSPEYFVYFEDFDISIRVNQVANIAYVPEVRIVHRGGFASRKGPTHVRLFAKSALIFFRKYGWKWL